MSQADSYHQPVLADEVVGYMVTRRDGTFVDATVGDGSHTLKILSHLGSSGKILAIDRDDDAIVRTRQRISKFSSQVILMRGEFANLKELAHVAGIVSVNGILFDLGVSSHQLDSAARGFSYRSCGPLDLRMDRRQPVTAATLVNELSAEELARILFECGGEKNAARIATAIVTARRTRRLETTTDLAAVIASVTNPRYVTKTLSRAFQGLRVFINRELEQLRAGLEAAVGLMAGSARLLVISYHSAEDRIVKNFFRDHARPGDGVTRLPVLRIMTKKPITPSPAEVRANPRARSAKLRVAEKQ